MFQSAIERFPGLNLDVYSVNAGELDYTTTTVDRIHRFLTVTSPADNPPATPAELVVIMTSPVPGDRIHVYRLGPATVLGPAPPSSEGLPRYQVRVNNGKEYKVLENDMITKRDRTESHPDLYSMTTPYESETRQGATPSSVFNLVSTILGGGVLSLPYAVQSSGLVLGGVALVLAALASAFTIDLMILASNRTGYAGYEDIGRGAYGRTAQIITISLIGLLTWLAAIAYGVLIGDMLVPPIELLGWHPGVWGRRLLIVCALLFISPLAFKRSLASLWFMGIVTVISVGFATAAVTYTTFAEAFSPGNHTVYGIDPHGEAVEHVVTTIKVDFLPQSYEKALSVFPVFGVAFLCHFNVLPMHTELRAPTVQRVRCVVLTTILLCTFVYFVVGYGGYIYGDRWTCGNILLNYNPKSTLFAVVRVFMAGTLMCSYPLLILPCRNSLNRLLFLCSATDVEEQVDVEQRLHAFGHIICITCLYMVISHVSHASHTRMWSYHVHHVQVDAEQRLHESSIDPSNISFVG